VPAAPERRRRWRDYRTGSGRRPIKEFLEALSDEDRASVLAAMADVRARGLVAARHLDALAKRRLADWRRRGT
jgi:hypothetical protein